MKRINILHLFSLILTLIIFAGMFNISFAKEDGAPSGVTGSPGDDETCAQVDCHTGSATERDNLISTDVPAAGYLSTETYLITVHIEEEGITRFGFQASPQNPEGDKMGEIILIDPLLTKETGGGKYITHTLNGGEGIDEKTWTFNWTPEESDGDVTFYVAVNASDDEGDATGDKIYTSSVTVLEDPGNFPLTVEEMNNIKFDLISPVTDKLQIFVSTPVNGDLEIILLDMHGKIIRQQKFGYSNGSYIIETDDIVPGIYFVTLSNDNGRVTKQFVKM